MTGTLWRLVERRLERALPPAHAASTIGDLAEDYARRRDDAGRIRAGLWLVRETWSLHAAYRTSSSPRERRDRIMVACEIRSALRRVMSRRGSALASACLVGAGIAVCTAAFSVVDAVLLRPAPFRDAGRLVEQRLGYAELALMEAWRSSGLFEQVEASRSSRVRFVGAAVHDWAAADVTPGIFDLLDVRPIRGRGFSRDAGVMATDEVIVSETVWRSVFGGDPAVIGRRIATADGSAVVVGIMPSRFRFPTSSTVVWRPLYPVARERGLFTIYGRLIAGVPVNAALEARLRVLAMELARLPRNYAGPPLRQVGVPDLDEATTRGLWLLFGGAALVFVALCTNVCGLVLSVLAARRRELGTCTALGASRARLVREAIVEHSVIGAGGIGAGVWMAWAATTAVPHVFQGHTLNLIDLDLRALAAASVLGLLAVLIAGVIPSWLGTRADAVDCLRGVRRVRGESLRAVLARQGMLVGEVALACSLLTGSILLIRSFVNLTAVDRGLRADGISRVRVSGLDDVFTSGHSMRLAANEIEARFAAWPAIVAVALSREIPPSPARDVRVYARQDDATTAVGGGVQADSYRVGAGFVELYGVALRRGRTFQRGDGAGRAIVSETLAARLWPGLDPIGRMVSLGRSAGPLQVIGVSADITLPSIDSALDLPEVFVPLGQESRTLYLSFRCRTACPNQAEIEARVRDVHPWLVARTASPADDEYLRQLLLPRAMAGVGGLFTIVAVLCAAGGLFSALMYSVGQRRREFGIRAALGASPRRIRQLVLRDGSVVVASGVVLGVIGSWIVARALAPFHYRVGAADPVTWAAVLVILGITAVAAAALPARRAARTDPAALLRHEHE